MAKKAAASKSAYAPIKTGVDPRKEASDNLRSSWMTIDPNTSVDAIILAEVEDILAVEQCAIWLDAGNSPVWVYTGPEDPSHELGVDRRYRAYLPLVVDGEVKVWSMSKTVHIQLLDIADAAGELSGLEVRIKRTGSGLTTRYSIVPKGKRHDVSRFEEPDVIAMLGPITSDEVKEMIAEKLGKESFEDVLEAYKGATKNKMNRVSLPKDEDEDEDEEEDVELL